ncbi:putative 3-demethylubiquinone-9 3-methyltransferase (glyoxalase superfamily) [Luteibacter jiangsuensis]|uniref:3-demethylubiquinone-9 3-methyltransferase (Glyoxalase superfamily) n=1 Tax=Luteibacter jiangsuensis TaxID=637577 RepID=A0ABT9SWM4_9GAMM|nr:VOC family protein [Luteibacter jiangsuensis]MDQ0009391.1 putative 3-demethylubiquinone-9 3-methyltransferase (glyoxalase superfamily) [Luteibacter jiangsuensis]
MSHRFQRITPFLWFDTEAEEAANYYVSIFPNSRVVGTTRYTKEVSAASGRPEGSVMTVAFELDGQPITALNGGPEFTFNEALSLVVHCHDQVEIDRFWEKLSAGGDPGAQACGWLKDKYGLSWQVVPENIEELVQNPGSVAALMHMTRLDIAAMKAAAT